MVRFCHLVRAFVKRGASTNMVAAPRNANRECLAIHFIRLAVISKAASLNCTVNLISSSASLPL